MTRVVVRCDGSTALGLGHVVRCLAVAAELRELGVEVVLAMREGGELVERRGFAVRRLPGRDEVAETAAVVRSERAAALLLDVRRDLDRAGVEELRGTGARIGILDDLDERRLAADVSFHPPVPQVGRLSWTGSSCTVRAGWDWVALRSAFAAPPDRAPGERPVVLVTMGGSDPAGLTLVALNALASVPGTFDVDVLVGPRFASGAALRAAAQRLARPVRVLVDVDDVPGLMARADVAVASFGMTAYELAACGVPAVHLCLTDCHAESAGALHDANVAVSLGRHDAVAPGTLRDETARLLDNRERRAAMSARGRALVDGLGARRIALELLGAPSQSVRRAADERRVPVP